MDIAEKKMVLFDAHLSHKGLQNFVDIAAELLGNPFFMADMSMGIVFKSSNMGSGPMDYSAENDVERRAFAAKQAADAGFLEWIYHNDEAVIGSFPEQPRYLSSRVRDGKEVLGHVVVVELYKRFEATDEKLLPMVCQIIAFELRHRFPNGTASAKLIPLLRELLSGDLPDEQTAIKRLSLLDTRLPPTMKLLFFKSFDISRTISEPYLQAQLQEAFPGSIGLPFANGYAHIIDGKLNSNAIATRLRDRIYTGGMGVGISRFFGKVTLLHAAYRQADAALRLCRDTPNGILVEYDDVAALHLAEFAAACKMDIGMLMVPELAILQESDKRDASNYVESLAAYLNNGRSVAKAAQALHVHKNSLYYRISRIEEQTGLDLSNERTCFLLQLSLAMLNMGPLGLQYSLE